MGAPALELKTREPKTAEPDLERNPCPAESQARHSLRRLQQQQLWDDHRKTHNHSAVVSLLEQRGLLNAYHHFSPARQGWVK